MVVRGCDWHVVDGSDGCYDDAKLEFHFTPATLAFSRGLQVRGTFLGEGCRFNLLCSQM